MGRQKSLWHLIAMNLECIIQYLGNDEISQAHAHGNK